MKDGDVVIANFPQQDGTIKQRPALCLCRIPPFDDLLVCGISKQLQQIAPELDEIITPADPDFRTAHLKEPSLIRLGFLVVLPKANFRGRMGCVSAARLQRLRTRLSDFLKPQPTVTKPN